MKAKYFKGHHVPELARRAGVSREYVGKLIKGDRDVNSDIAKKIIKAVEVMEKALEAADQRIERIFNKP